MCARWVHFHVTLFGTIDFTSLLEMPLRLAPDRAQPLYGIVAELLDADAHWPKSPLWRKARRHELASSLVRRLSEFSPLRRDSQQLLGSMVRLAPALRYISEHVSEPLSSAMLAKAACMSVSWFQAAFKRQLGLSPMEYVKRCRLERASHLLISTDMSLQEIASQVGFKNPFHFSREFKRRFGTAPSVYRNTHLNMISQLGAGGEEGSPRL
jgi:AraC-like DNA-binding protein